MVFSSACWLTFHRLLPYASSPSPSDPLADLSWWSIVPFACMLLGIAILPQALPHLWEHEWFRGVFSAVLGLPMLLWISTIDVQRLSHTLQEYSTFLLLLTALYTICGGLYLQGRFAGTPWSNTLLLLAGACSASLIGTTGAAMLFIRPVMRAIAWRRYRTHTMVCFIFLICNIGGLLTPLGDPPLFLGFLRGVPFAWTLHFWPIWSMMCGTLLLGYLGIDHHLYKQEDRSKASHSPVPLALQGRWNLVYLAGVIGLVLFNGLYHWSFGILELGLLVLIGLSFWTTAPQIHHANNFSWIPIREVGMLFFGIFLTMIPALALLNNHGSELPLRTPGQFFWSTGMLSAFLDNAPTYLAFSATASSLLGTHANALQHMLETEQGTLYLQAISLGAVCMGALTYIGNGPNLIVKSIAEQEGIPMPSFFAYFAWSMICLVPLFMAVHWLHF